MSATPAVSSQTSRLLSTGFTRADVVDVRTIRRDFVPSIELERVTRLERLDEIEELELVLAHYAVAWASKGEVLKEVGLRDAGGVYVQGRQ